MGSDLILITGASSDIGVTLARHILKTSDAIIIAHSFQGNARVASLVEENPDRVHSLQADFTDEASVLQFAGDVLSIGTPTAVVHLPALKLRYERFTKVKWQQFESDLSVQVRSAVTLLQKLLPPMTKLPRARVIFVLSSVVHGVPPKYMSLYTTLKYAQLGLMRALAAEYAATSVRINAISPSMVETQFLENIGSIAVEMSAQANPLGRNARPEDLLGLFELLLSDRADFMSGLAIPVAAGSVN